MQSNVNREALFPQAGRRERTPFPALSVFELEEKTVFLNKKNLSELEGHKAIVVLKSNGELHVVITGHSPRGASRLFSSLTAMNPEDIKSDDQ